MSKSKKIILSICVISIWCGLAIRLFLLQVWSVKTTVESFALRTSYQNAPRGLIRDRNGDILAMSQKVIVPFLDSRMITDTEEIYRVLKKLNIDISLTELSAMVKTGKRYIPLNYELTFEEVEVLKKEKLPGLGFEQRHKRIYPEGDMVKNLIGVCTENVKSGIERAFDKYLSGKVIRITKQRDGAGRNIPEDFYLEEVHRGADVYLTIDKIIQRICDNVASNTLVETSAEKVIIVVQEPNSGEILAMSCRSREPKSSIPEVSDIFEPGSTYKVFTYLHALSEGVIKEDELIFCENGKYRIYNHEINDVDKKATLTIREAFAFSSNIACAKIAQRLSQESIRSYTRNFGFGCLTGINIPGESKGLVRKFWDPLTTITITFGQGIGVTPIQLVNAYSAIANGGYLLEPQIVKKIKTPDGKITYESHRKVIRKVADEKTVETIKEMLSDVVKYGSGKLAGVYGYKVGGKTGTAQKINPKTGNYSHGEYVSSFCGIFPIDEPHFTILVIVDTPRHGNYLGSIVAAPLFSKIATEIAGYKRIPPSDIKQVVLVK